MKLTNCYRNSIRFFALCFFFVFAISCTQKNVKIIILHTNDTHSQVEVLSPTDPKNPDMGGYARRMGMIEKIRGEEPNVLLLDAGDYWQGTPYFNFFNGRIEIDAMNRMGYDAATLGNHEFDNGTDTLAAVLSEAAFPVISSNYTFEHDRLGKLIKPYVVLERAGLHIGIMALNVNPEGLIIQSNYEGVTWIDPITAANETAKFLKEKRKCDLIICLSHMGADPEKFKENDFKLVQNTRNIDLVIGGHSHQLIENTTAKNLDGKNIIIAQMGKSGLHLGRIDLVLEKR